MLLCKRARARSPADACSWTSLRDRGITNAESAAFVKTSTCWGTSNALRLPRMRTISGSCCEAAPCKQALG